MRQVIVIGTTESIINLNKIGVPVRGKSRAILNIANNEQESELMGVVRAGLLDIVPSPDVVPNRVAAVSLTAEEKPQVSPQKKQVSPQKKTSKTPPPPPENKRGRPKGSKNKTKDSNLNSLAADELKRVSEAEARTQKMGSRVIIGTSDGAKQGRMSRSAIDDMVETEQTRASIEAMEKLEKEEKEEINLPDTPIDESKLDASEQMGRKAVVATEGGLDRVDLVNSILPEAKCIREADPFIDTADKKAQKEVEEKRASEKAGDDDGPIDAFIEI